MSEQRGGNTGPIYLVPELCNMTGLSDEQRANFKLMQDMGAFTRQDPVKRTQVLKKFAERLNTQPEVNEDMKVSVFIFVVLIVLGFILYKQG